VRTLGSWQLAYLYVADVSMLGCRGVAAVDVAAALLLMRLVCCLFGWRFVQLILVASAALLFLARCKEFDVVLVLVLVLIWFGYRLFSYEKSESNRTRTPTQ